MKISIIGAGNGGQAMAGHFAILGHEVCLYNRTTSRIKNIQKSKRIQISDAITGIGNISLITTNLIEALDFADLIMVTTTADAHQELAKKMSAHLRENHLVVLNPGRTLGAIEFSKIIRTKCQTPISIAEAQSLIYACRVESPGKVRVIGVKDNVLLAAFPASETNLIINKLNSIVPCFVKAKNVLITSLENIGAIFHPAVVLFNAATIERGQSFYFYNEMTLSVANFLEQLDAERIAIGRAFGINLRSASDWVSFAYKNIRGETLCEKMRNNPAYYKIFAPTSLKSRLLFEDIPTGILPLIELARMAGVPVPLMQSVFNISQALLKTDFRLAGRTLKNLDLEGVSVNAFINSL